MDDEQARNLLTAERQRIERELGLFDRQDDGEIPDATDPGNSGADLAEAEFDEGRQDDLRQQLAAVERAEKRLAEGTYGLSIETGKPIPDERLQALPAAERTVEEERAHLEK